MLLASFSAAICNSRLIHVLYNNNKSFIYYFIISANFLTIVIYDYETFLIHYDHPNQSPRNKK